MPDVKCQRNGFFQQDNDRKHTSTLLKNFFSSKKINVMKWPSQSPDLNPIEHLWEVLDRRTKSIKVKNSSETFDVLAKEWAAMDQGTITSLIDSMPRRCQAVINSKGYPTKY